MSNDAANSQPDRGTRKKLSWDLSHLGDEFIAQVDAAREMIKVSSTRPRAIDKIDLGDADFSEIQRTALRKSVKDLKEVLEGALSWNLSAEAGTVSPPLGGTISNEDPAVHRALWRLIYHTAHNIRKPDRESLLLKSIVYLAVSDFELLLGRVAKSAMLSRPGMLGGDAGISLRELEALESIGDARELVADRRVDELLRKGLDDWDKWFQKLGVSLRDMADGWEQLVEIFARRNVLVHAGGRVSKQYVEVVRSSGGDPSSIPDVGTPIDPTVAYVLEATERLLSFGVLILCATWLQLSGKDSKDVESWMVLRVQHLLELNLSSAAYKVCNTVLTKSRGRLSGSTEMKLKTCSWVANLQLGNTLAVQEEVRNWDTSAIDLKHSHVKYVILEDDDRAVEAINELQRRGQLSSVDLATSPLYRGIIARRAQDLVLNGVTKELVDSIGNIDRSADSIVSGTDDSEPANSGYEAGVD